LIIYLIVIFILLVWNIVFQIFYFKEIKSLIEKLLIKESPEYVVNKGIVDEQKQNSNKTTAMPFTADVLKQYEEDWTQETLIDNSEE